MIKHISRKFSSMNIPGDGRRSAADPIELSSQQSAIGNILSQMSETDLKDAIMILLNLHSAGTLNPKANPHNPNQNPKNMQATSKVEQMVLSLLKPGQVKIPFSEGHFEGEVINGRPNGHGQCKYKDNSSYRGEYRQGKKEGVGMYRWKDGSVYSGEYVGGKKQGIGRMDYVEGESYEGSWREDKMHGWGVTVFGERREQAKGAQGAQSTQGEPKKRKVPELMVNRWDMGTEEGEYFWISADRKEVKFGAYKGGKEHGERRVFQVKDVKMFKHGKLV